MELVHQRTELSTAQVLGQPVQNVGGKIIGKKVNSTIKTSRKSKLNVLIISAVPDPI